MEKIKQLSTQAGGGCAEILHHAADGKPTLGAFLKLFEEVVALRGDRDYASMVLHDLQLALLEGGEFELARQVAVLELEARRVAQAAQQGQKATMHIDTFNGSLSAIYENGKVAYLMKDEDERFKD